MVDHALHIKKLAMRMTKDLGKPFDEHNEIMKIDIQAMQELIDFVSEE